MSIPANAAPAAADAVADADAFPSSSSARLGLLLPTPSSLDGVPAHVEARLRAYGCGLIVRACAALQQRQGQGGEKEKEKLAAPPVVPAATAATAQALLHRFYLRHSLARPATGDVRRVAAAMTWLALKLEEGYGDAHRATRRLLLVFARLEARDDCLAENPITPRTLADAETPGSSKSSDSPPPPLLLAYSRPYEQRRASLVRIERLALDAAGFSCAVEHPHKLLLGLSHVLSSSSSSSSNSSDSPSTASDPSTSSSSPSLAEEAWALANDSLRTPLCVRFGPEAVAAGCLFLASRRLGVALPEGGDGEGEGKQEEERGNGGGDDDENNGEEEEERKGKTSSAPWWSLLGVSTRDVFEVARVVHALLESEPPRYEDASAWLREKRKREEEGDGKGGEEGGGGGRAAATTTTAAAPLPAPSKLGSAAASAVAKARAAAARAAAARKRPRAGR